MRRITNTALAVLAMMWVPALPTGAGTKGTVAATTTLTLTSGGMIVQRDARQTAYGAGARSAETPVLKQRAAGPAGTAGAAAASGASSAGKAAKANGKGRYADVNGVRMYYEIHGTGKPVVLVHGGLSAIDSTFGAVLPTLAKSCQVIAVELQGHGHTGDIDRPLRIEQLGDDLAALLEQLKIARADFVGYSFGGMVSLGMAVRHPKLVNRVVLVGTPNSFEGLEPPIREAIKSIPKQSASERAAGLPPGLKDAYEKVAPDPSALPNVLLKVSEQLVTFPGWRPEDLRALKTPVLIVVGDRDFVRPEHAVELFRMIPGSQLAILPNAGHDALNVRPDAVLGAIAPFLAAPAATPSATATR